MAIKAHNMATKVNTAAGTVTFSMLNRNDVAVVEHTMPIEMALGILSFVLQAMDDADMFEEVDEPEEIVGHC